MRPKPKMPTIEAYVEPLLVNFIDMDHPLVKLANIIDWDTICNKLIDIYKDSKTGRPAKDIRLMVGIHYLKYTYNLSDEDVIARWVENPYYQYFTGEETFQRKFPTHPSNLTRFRKRLENKNLSDFLMETIKAGFMVGYLGEKDIQVVAVDTTVQEKYITFPTDIKLYYKMILRLNRFCRTNNIKLHETFERSGKIILRKYYGYSHAKQSKRASKMILKMKSKMIKLYRSIGRVLSEELRNSDEFKRITELYERLCLREKDSKNKLYSLHAPEVECISKGKVNKRYEFGNKVGIVGTLKKNFILSCLSFHGNPYDGNTLNSNMEDAVRNVSLFGRIKMALADLGYRGKECIDGIKLQIVPKSLKKFSYTIRNLLKRRSCIEATIGHTKRDNRMGKNYLKGKFGDRFNAVFAACGHNLRMILSFLAFFVLFFAEIIVMRVTDMVGFLKMLAELFKIETKNLCFSQ